MILTLRIIALALLIVSCHLAPRNTFVFQELENERRKAVEANIEQMSTLRKIREEAMDAKKMELDAAIEKMEKVRL